MVAFRALVSFSLTLAVIQAQPVKDSSYVAAVFEHNFILNPEPWIPLSREDALKHMKKNLDIYEEQAAKASKQGVQILVFPECGIHGVNFSRSSIFNYLEMVPDPEQERWNPCTEPEKHNNTEVLQRLSCMARLNKLYLVANVASKQPCPLSTDPSSSCPPDGHWQFNTNVAFRSDGLLVARYNKYNLFFEAAFDTPPQPEIITFETPFAGKFGLFICFDILFYQPTIALVEQGVRQLVFPTAWMNALPLLDSVQFHRALSLTTNTTVLSANIREDVLNMRGSGIYTPFSSIYHHAWGDEPEQGRLLVARVPVLDPEWLEINKVSQERMAAESVSSSVAGAEICPPESCPDISSVPPSSNTFVTSMMYDPYTFVFLKETEGTVNVCNGSFCCQLQYHLYTQEGSEERYALGAFDGLHTVDGTYYLQVCAIVRCAGSDPSSCGDVVEEAETKMDFLLEGRFGTKYVYPSVLLSRMVVEDPEYFKVLEGGKVSMKHANMKGGLVTASLYGRVYERDDQ